MNKPSVKKSGIAQTIDLEQLTGVDLSDARSLKESIGQALIDVIKERTEQGLGYKSIKLKSPYSKAYTKSLEFRAAGKSANDVNMTLTGDMLASVDVKAGDTDITLYIPEDQTLKAYNHLTGDTVPKRNWFGVTKKEVQTVLEQFKDDIESLRPETRDEVETLSAIDFVRQRFDPFEDED